MTEIRKPKQCLALKGFGHGQRRRLRRVLNIGIWDLFEIWCLEFVILDTKLQVKAGELWPGPKDQVFQDKINGIQE